MTRVTGRVSLPYGRSQATTPVCGHVRYVWVGGVADQGEQVLIPGVAVARIIDGVVEDINLSPGRWLPVLVVDGCRYDLPEIIVEASDVPAPTPPSPEPEPTLPRPRPHRNLNPCRRHPCRSRSRFLPPLRLSLNPCRCPRYRPSRRYRR